MQLIQSFDPSQSLTNGGVIQTNGINRDEQLVLYNDSIYGLLLTFSDGSTDVLPAAWNKDWIKPNIPMGNIAWSLYNTMDVDPVDYPFSVVYGAMYEADEHVPSVNQSMQRGFTITGGKVTTNTTTSIDNEGNAAGSIFLKSVLSNQTATSINITNDGTGSIAILLASVLTNILQLIQATATGQDVLKLGALNYIVHILGNLLVDGTIQGSLNDISSDGGKITSNGAGAISTDGGASFSNGGGIWTLAGLQLPNNIYTQHKDTGGTYRSGIGLGNDNHMRVWMLPSDVLYIEDPTSSIKVAQFNGNNARNALDLSGNSSTTSNLAWVDGSHTASSHAWTCSNSGTGVTVNHNCPIAPQINLATCNSGSSYGTCTTGIGHVTATTLLCSSGAVLSGIYGYSQTYN